MQRERAKGRRRPRRARRAAIDRGYLIDNFGRDALIPAASGSVKKKVLRAPSIWLAGTIGPLCALTPGGVVRCAQLAR